MPLRFPLAPAAILFLTLTACSASDSSPASPSAGDGDGGGSTRDGSTPVDAGAPGVNPSPDSGTSSGDGSAGVHDASGGGPEGGGSDSGGNDGESDAASGPFTLASSAIGQNASVPQAYTCATQSTQNAQGTGCDASPPLAWSGAPSGTMSYAVVLHDDGNGNTHWVLYDIPPSVTSLAEGVPKTATLAAPAGAKQTKSYDGSYGYMGPCPNVLHTYTFTVYAMPTATTAGITAGNRAAAETTIKGAALGAAVLTVTSSDSQG